MLVVVAMYCMYVIIYIFHYEKSASVMTCLWTGTSMRQQSRIHLSPMRLNPFSHVLHLGAIRKMMNLAQLRVIQVSDVT